MRLEKHFEYVSQGGNTQQWRSASQALEVAWRGTLAFSSIFLEYSNALFLKGSPSVAGTPIPTSFERLPIAGSRSSLVARHTQCSFCTCSARPAKEISDGVSQEHYQRFLWHLVKVQSRVFGLFPFLSSLYLKILGQRRSTALHTCSPTHHP